MGRLGRNALANIVQAAISAVLLFALYRYVSTTLGVAKFGIWSVVLATVSASRIADMGLSAGVTRYVARDLARSNPDRAAEVINTAVLTLAGAVGLLLPLIYPLLAGLLAHLFTAAHLTLALDILPYAMGSLWLTVIAAVVQSGFDGCQRMQVRAGLVVVGQVVLLLLAFLLVPRHGLVGLAWAQVGQGLFLAIGGWLLLRRALPQLPWLPRLWRWSVLREMLGYGLNVQAATVFMLLLDPVAKALMARFGGAAAAGYFEMANQVVVKVRALIVAANQAIVPRVAEVAEAAPRRLTAFYQSNVRLLTFVAAPVYALLFIWGGWASWLLLGRYSVELAFLLRVCTLAWAANTLAAPAYFMLLGAGGVRWNTLAHVTMGTVNATLGWVLGSRFGTAGVAWAYASAIAIGSWLLLAIFQHRFQAGSAGWVAREHRVLEVVCLAVVAAAWLGPAPVSRDSLALVAAWSVGASLALASAVWFHPMRKRLLDRVVGGEARS